MYQYVYDAFGRRIAKLLDTDGDNTVDQQERYVYDGDNIALAFDGPEGTDLTHRYVHGPVVDQVLADEQIGGDVLWPLTDNLGTVRDLAKDNSGTTELLNHLVYNAFGKVTSETDAAVDSLFGFTGRERDEETGLNYYRARYYEPETGKFLSEDPDGFRAGDANLTRYCRNVPVSRRDPTGRNWIQTGQTFMYGTIPMRELYAVDAGWLWNSPPVYLGMEDPTGVVYRMHKETSDVGGALGLTQTWYRKLDNEAYCVSRAKLEQHVTGWFHIMTGDWDQWFKDNDTETAKFDTLPRKAVLDGFVKDPASWYNQKTQTMDRIATEATVYAATLPLAVTGATSYRVSPYRAPAPSATAPARVVDAWAQRHASITSRLQEHLQQAVKQAKLTPAQARDIMKNGRASTHWGTQIDTRFKELVQNDPLLRGDVVVSPRTLPKGSGAPDVIDLRSKRWWDVTSTAEEFAKKPPKYCTQYGEGTSLHYGEP